MRLARERLGARRSGGPEDLKAKLWGSTGLAFRFIASFAVPSGVPT